MFHSWHNRDWTPLFRSELLSELNRLEFTNFNLHAYQGYVWPEADVVEHLAKCPHLTNLRHLALHMVRDKKNRFERISEARGLDRVSFLSIARGGIGRRAARAFAKSDIWDNLEYCLLDENRLDDLALSHFAMGRTRPKLECLDIRYGRYTDVGLVELSRSSCFPNLKKLCIGYSTRRPTRFGRVGIESLLQSSADRPYQLEISIRSSDPIPKEIEELGQNRSDRVVLEHRRLRYG